MNRIKKLIPVIASVLLIAIFTGSMASSSGVKVVSYDRNPYKLSTVRTYPWQVESLGFRPVVYVDTTNNSQIGEYECTVTTYLMDGTKIHEYSAICSYSNTITSGEEYFVVDGTNFKDAYENKEKLFYCHVIIHNEKVDADLTCVPYYGGSGGRELIIPIMFEAENNYISRFSTYDEIYEHHPYIGELQ